MPYSTPEATQNNKKKLHFSAKKRSPNRATFRWISQEIAFWRV